MTEWLETYNVDLLQRLIAVIAVCVMVYLIVRTIRYVWRSIQEAVEAIRKKETPKNDEQKINNESLTKSVAKKVNSLVSQDNLTIIALVIFILLIVALLIYVIIIGVRAYNSESLFSALNLSNFGSLGDFFGGVIGTFVAAIVAIYAIRTYKSERELQKAGVISDMLSTMLELHKRNVEEIEITHYKTSTRKYKGRDAFKPMYDELFDIFEHVYAAIRAEVEKDHQKYAEYLDEKKQMKLAHILSYGYFFYSAGSYMLVTAEEDSVLYDLCIEAADKVPEPLRKLNRHNILGHYYRHLFNMVNYIDKNKFSNDYKKKEIYVKLIRSQLSDYEEMLLYYDSLSPLGKDWNEPLGSRKIEKMNLICKYRLLKNCPIYKPYFGIMPFETYHVEKEVWDKSGDLFLETDPQGQYKALKEMLK